ncbi:MAG: HAD family phosphatase [Bacteroidales bacterium]|nr:HAD family phosphatase [Bacteroidales bacterium]
MIKNIIFDFGGVLYDIRYQNIPEAFARLGLPNFEKLYSKKQQNDVMDQYEEGLISTEEFRQYIHKLAPIALTDAQIDDCWNSIMIQFPNHHEAVLRKASEHYHLYLFSNTNQLNYEQFRKEMLEQFGFDLFDRYFQKCYFSQLLHIRKPKEAGFQHIIAENKLNPSETLFIDDSPQHLIGAKACGLQTLHLQDGMDVADLFDEQGVLRR